MSQDLPPPNRAIGWYRFMLWLMPTCVALTSLFPLVWLLNYKMGLTGKENFWIWLVINLATTFGIGLFEARLRQPPSSEPAESAQRFLLLQVLIVPALSCTILFALCLTSFA